MYFFDIRRLLEKKPEKEGNLIIYWMRRDYRIFDNWSLIYALNESNRLKKIFCIYIFLNFSNTRKYTFVKNAIEDIKKICKSLNFSLAIGYGDPYKIFSKLKYCKIITDINPFDKPLFEVEQIDAHNIVPIWVTSNKKEYTAHTIRSKIFSKLDIFLTDFPILKPLNQKFEFKKFGKQKKIIKINNICENATYETGMKKLDFFIQYCLNTYESSSILSNIKTSHLSPWIHFGIISTQKCILNLFKQNKKCDRFIDEILIRKELADNFCFYAKDIFDLPNWCILNIDKHKSDVREKIYTLDELEKCLTDDDIWNKIQAMMNENGFVLNYLRMYWAKKIAYWTKDIETAINYALYLNDKYFLDGEDCIGVTNILWCLTGLHDRPFQEREILGKVRYFTSNKCKKILNNL